MSYKKSIFLSLIIPLMVFCTDKSNDSETRAQNLFENLMCPVCDGQTISESQSELSKNMRNMVRKKLDEDLTNNEILDYFESKYGTSVLANPPKSGFYYTVWIVPIFLLPILFLGLLILIGNFINPKKDF